MASLLSTAPSPMATLPTGLRATARTCQHNNFQTTRVPLVDGLKLLHKFQLKKAVERSSALPRCHKSSISCSIALQSVMVAYVQTFQFIDGKQRGKQFKAMASDYTEAQPETLQTVQTTIAKQLSIDESTVTPETKFADLGADSLDTVEIMMALEEKFGVSIGEGGAENISTVKDAADLIEKVKAGQV